jgi:hypothetical protein
LSERQTISYKIESQSQFDVNLEKQENQPKKESTSRLKKIFYTLIPVIVVRRNIAKMFPKL